MNPSEILPDDPRLTAYALQEMEQAELAEFESMLQSNPAAQRAVNEIRAAGVSLTAALEHEPVEAAQKKAEGEDPYRAKVLRFPQFYYVISGIAAACFAVFFVLWQRDYQPKQATRLVEVPLTPPAADSEQPPQDSKPRASSETDYSLLGTTRPSINRSDFSPSGSPVLLARSLPYGGTTLTFSGRRGMRTVRTEGYAQRTDNGYVRVADEPLSTFSADVDTASYSNVRRFLVQGERPPVDAVRIEEMVNYFPYQYHAPEGDLPFAANLEVATAPWAPEHRLVRIGLKGREVSDGERPSANLVFLLDVSASMNVPNKLPLVKQSLRLLVNKLRPDDSVAIAVYAGSSGLALRATKVVDKAKILEAIELLESAGSTNGAAGIELAYAVAKANFIPGGVNRVILATDGDFNVGQTSDTELARLITQQAKGGVFLSVLGFGMGNLQDATLEQLADKGNGNYAYIDTLAEAKKALVEQAGGTLVTIAKDVKFQVEFNPAVVQAYRLIGYENRLLAKEDFNNDQIDAGEIGAGHTLTALYEVVPVGVESNMGGSVDPLKYQTPPARAAVADGSAEMLTVKIRYKEPASDVSSKLEFVLHDGGARFEDASQDFKFAAAVAAFGMQLRDSPYKGSLTLDSVSAWARSGIGHDPGGYRNEFVGLVGQARQFMQ